MNVNERRVSLALFMVLAALMGGLAWMFADWPEQSMVAASTNHYDGPVFTDDLEDGHGTSHSSKVWHYKDTDPHFVAQAYPIHYAGRRPDQFCSWNKRWRLENRKYYEWDSDDSAWDEVSSVGPSLYTNTGTPGLAWHNDYDNVFMGHGAYVKQRLRYSYHACTFDGGDEVDFAGTWHYHYLE